MAFTLWLLLTEMSVEAWYRAHEAKLPRAVQWTVAWPVNDPTFRELPLAKRTRQILRYDEGRSAAWGENGIGWQAIFLRWNPGRTALHLAENHTPEVCMTAAGHTLEVVSELELFEVRGARPPRVQFDAEHQAPSQIGIPRSESTNANVLRLPFAVYQIKDAGRTFYVFYCLWNDRAAAQGFATQGLTRFNRLAPVLNGIRNPGQRSLEIAVSGPDNAAAAETAMRAELEKIIMLK